MTNRFHSDADELELLRSTARRFFEAGSTYESLTELGFHSLLAPEAAGGGGWLPIEASIVAEEAGRSASPLPLISVLLASAAAAACRHDELLAQLLAGNKGAALAHTRAPTAARTGQVSGRLTCTGSDRPEVILALDEEDQLVVIEVAGSRRSIADALDTTRSTTEVDLDDAAVTRVDPEEARLLLDTASLLLAADSLGGLASSAQLVRQHLVDRSAFGRPLASFQALQHRLVDLEILETSMRALLRRAATSLAESSASAPRLVAALRVASAQKIPAAIDDCIQLAGGIGFTWEWPLHHAMRRSMASGPLLAVPVRSQSFLTAEPSPEASAGPEPAFRAHVREVIRLHRPYEAREGRTTPESPEQELALRRWHATMFSEGLAGASWPAEHGGSPEHREIHEMIVTEELIRARAPRLIDQVKLSSHVLLKFGTEEQKARYLPRIRSGEDVWCQLLSEPDAGSDLAGIKARAVQQPDGTWVLSGQKTWTTDGHWAQMGVALLRTSDEPKRHAGMTAFLVPMDSPGLVLQPMRTIIGTPEFNDTFLDGVVLPADSVLGQVGEGWAVAMAGLEVERLGIGGNVVLLDMLLDDLRTLIAGLRADGRLTLPEGEVDHRLSELVVEAQLAKAFVLDHVDRALLDQESEGDGSISKVLYTETYNRIARYGAEVAMAHSPLPPGTVAAAQRLNDSWLWSRSLTISGGSSEVMRNIVGKRRLRLPQ